MSSVGKDDVDQSKLLRIFGTEIVDVCNLLFEFETFCFPQVDGIYKSLEEQYEQFLIQTKSGVPKAVTLAKKYSKEKGIKVEMD